MHLSYHDAGHGYDRLGMHPDWVRMAVGLLEGAYSKYFRVESHGIENVPQEGAAILCANHSGMLPIDAIMLYLDVVQNTFPPRVPRMVMDVFVPKLPFVSSFFARGGGVSGARGTVRRLLADGELLGIFPEGTPGISKPFSERYKLTSFRVGHAELAIRHRTPIIPIAIIGAEEQFVQLARLDIHPFGAPFVPLPASPVPLPVRYRIHYGEPIALHDQYEPKDADDPTVCRAAANEVQAAVQALIDRGLEEREAVFW
jgi:1-acyl-sn-glycerol-3-phosphate acyltransferase